MQNDKYNLYKQTNKQINKQRDRRTDRRTDRRDNSISYIRLVAMIMILLCHSFQYYGNELAWWLNLGVQIFFVVSGFLYGSKEIPEPIDFLKKQFKKILIPYYAFIIPVIVTHALFLGQGVGFLSILKLIFCVGTIDGIEHLWFVGYILFCYSITPYLYWFRKKTEKFSLVKMSILCATIIVAITALTVLTDFYFVASRFCCYIIGYFIAVFYKKYNYKSIKIFALIFGVFAVPVNAFRIYLKSSDIILEVSLVHKIFNFVEPYAHLLLGVFLFLIMYLLFKNSKTGIIVKTSDKYSYYIYVVHQIFVLGPFSLMSITDFTILNYAIVVSAIAIATLVLHFISLRIFKKI